MHCPSCNVDLVMSERQGVEIDYCPKCRGVWLDRGELDKIIERANTVALPPVGDRQRGHEYFDDDDDRKRQGHKKPRNFLSDLFD